MMIRAPFIDLTNSISSIILMDKATGFENLSEQFSPATQTSSRAKANVGAGKGSSLKNSEKFKIYCLVSFTVLQTKDDADLQMTLAMYLSLWDPFDVKLQWDVVHRKNE